MSEDRLDLRNPLGIRAFMARNGFAPGQLRPWDSPDHGYTDPLDSAETKADVRRFMALVWQAALDATTDLRWNASTTSTTAHRSRR